MTPIHLFYLLSAILYYSLILLMLLSALLTPIMAYYKQISISYNFILEEIICFLYYFIMIFCETFSHRIAKLSSYFIIVFNLFTFVLNLCSLNQLCFLYTRAAFTQRVAVDHKLNKYHLDRSKELKFSLEYNKAQ